MFRADLCSRELHFFECRSRFALISDTHVRAQLLTSACSSREIDRVSGLSAHTFDASIEPSLLRSSRRSSSSCHRRDNLLSLDVLIESARIGFDAGFPFGRPTPAMFAH